MRSRVGDPVEFFLAYDCWMALTVEYTLRLIEALRPYRLKWLEEFLPPDDYAGYAEVRRRAPNDLLLTTGEHEWTRWGFRQLIDNRCCDVIQPDVNWCGGLTELLKIAAYASAHGVLVVPHGSSVYSYHFVVTRHESPFAEFLMMAPDAASVVPMFTPLLTGEPVPEGGRIKASALDRPGFGVELDRSLPLERLFPR
jgi:L-rhamnonate dehydratase